MKSQPKPEHIHIRASKHQKALLAGAARKRDLSLSQFVLQAVLPVANDVLQQNAQDIPLHVELDDEAWAEFNRLLDAPVRDLAELRKLLLSKPVWEE